MTPALQVSCCRDASALEEMGTQEWETMPHCTINAPSSRHILRAECTIEITGFRMAPTFLQAEPILEPILRPAHQTEARYVARAVNIATWAHSPSHVPCQRTCCTRPDRHCHSYLASKLCPAQHHEDSVFLPPPSWQRTSIGIRSFAAKRSYLSLNVHT